MKTLKRLLFFRRRPSTERIDLMRRLRQGSALLLASTLFFAANNIQAAPRLKVSENKHFLVKEDGAPFFYLGDTAWELFHRLNREEADIYLSNRAAKGFTVIQAVVLAELDGLKTPNPYGDVPFEDANPGKPVEAYFKHVDYIVNKAESLGLYIGMLPSWGDKWNKKWGVGPEVFDPKTAEAYGEFLGKRYKDKPIIWILGGDRSPEGETHLAVIRAMAKGLRKGDGGNHLLTYHPMGDNNSAEWFHNDDWLDFNMFQSGHGAVNIPNYRMTLKNYRLTPPKPALDGEPRYEDHPINWKSDQGWFDEWDVRQAAYWSMLSGACGHTYGNHNIWQMFQPDRKPVSSARTLWKEAMDHPGALQMGLMKRLFESRPYQKLIPDQSIIIDGQSDGAGYVTAAMASDQSFGFVYIPTGNLVVIKMNQFLGSRVRCYWFNPRDGVATQIGDVPSLGYNRFEPPTKGRGQDWVLVLDDAAANYPEPGSGVEKSK